MECKYVQFNRACNRAGVQSARSDGIVWAITQGLQHKMRISVLMIDGVKH